MSESNLAPDAELIKLAWKIAPAWVACSGGIDSLWLFHFLKKIAEIEVKPVFFDHPGVYPEERSAALALISAAAGIVLDFGQTEMAAVWAGVAEKRCYRCKKYLFRRALAQMPVAVTLCDGSHVDDQPARRPGMRALAELGIVSPLRECGWDKALIRASARKAGLKSWQQPARACLLVDGKIEI